MPVQHVFFVLQIDLRSGLHDNQFMSDLLPVKPFQETLYGSYCGPASLKMVLGYFGVEKTEK